MYRSIICLFLLFQPSAEAWNLNTVTRVPVRNEESEISIMKDHDRFEDYYNSLPHTYINQEDLPLDFSWGNVSNRSFLTRMLNQHIPRYCGSCWAHAAISSLSDRIKIAMNNTELGPEINLSIQYVLNCGGGIAGSCRGGSSSGAYQFVRETGFVPFETCLTYEACSADTCFADDYTCKPINTCRTCSTFDRCSSVEKFPYATIEEYGIVRGEGHMMAEIFARGPIACEISARPLKSYTRGIVSVRGFHIPDHVVSIVGWGYSEEEDKHYWIVRNSWGQYWGEMGFFRIERGRNVLSIEQNCAWATPGPMKEL